MDVIEILKGINENKKDYWLLKNRQRIGMKSLQTDCFQGKRNAWNLRQNRNESKNEILIYKRFRVQKTIKISDKSEKYCREEIDKLLNKSIKAEQNGVKKQNQS